MSAVKPTRSEQNKLPEKGSTRIERGIYRVNYPSHKGIRAYLKFKDFEFQKVFALGNGERQALAAARKWREEKLREIQNMPEARNPLKKLMKNNTSGITGVRRRETAWSATWVENGKQQYRSFAVEKFSEKEAFRLACQARAQAEQRMYGEVFQDALKG
ncbi:MAG: AP2/ERF family transcription factor [Pyrinomonadaceae bacterium]